MFGVTFMVMAPEHPILEKITASSIKNLSEVEAYKTECAKKTEFERTQLVKDKTGVCIDGLTAINPVNGKEIPIFICRLRNDGLRYRRDHGCSGARPARLRVREEVRHRYHRGHQAAATSRRKHTPATVAMVNSEFLNGIYDEERSRRERMLEVPRRKRASARRAYSTR